MRKKLLGAALAAMAVLTASGQGPAQPAGTVLIRRLDGSTISAAEIDATMTRLMQAAHVTGAGIALLNDGDVVYEKAYGWRDAEKRAPLTVDSVMTAASLSKSAFATMVMKLAQEGAVDLDAPIARYLPKPLPEYPGYENLAGDARWKRLTLRMLLDHTSGFANLRSLEPDRKLRFHFDPGTRFAYSGVGINLAQFVVETATKHPLEELMREHIFEPSGMTRTSMVWQARFEDDFANAYDEQEHSLGPQRRTTANAAGGMQTTLADYGRFLSALMRGRLLSARSGDAMFRPQIAIHSLHEFPTLAEETTKENDAIRLSYGVGWGLYWTPYGEAFFKEGHDEGFRHYAVVFRKPKTGLLIMTNSSNGEGIYQELLETALKNPYTPIEWENFTPYNKMK